MTNPVYIQCPECYTFMLIEAGARQYTPCACGRIEYKRTDLEEVTTFDVRRGAAAEPRGTTAWAGAPVDMPSEEYAARLNVASLVQRLDAQAQAITRLAKQIATLEDALTGFRYRLDLLDADSGAEVVARKLGAYLRGPRS